MQTQHPSVTPTRPVRALVRVQTEHGPQFEWRDIGSLAEDAPHQEHLEDQSGPAPDKSSEDTAD